MVQILSTCTPVPSQGRLCCSSCNSIQSLQLSSLTKSTLNPQDRQDGKQNAWICQKPIYWLLFAKGCRGWGIGKCIYSQPTVPPRQSSKPCRTYFSSFHLFLIQKCLWAQQFMKQSFCNKLKKKRDFWGTLLTLLYLHLNSCIQPVLLTAQSQLQWASSLLSPNYNKSI